MSRRIIPVSPHNLVSGARHDSQSPLLAAVGVRPAGRLSTTVIAPVVAVPELLGGSGNPFGIGRGKFIGYHSMSF
jgi:hypothetical protein